MGRIYDNRTTIRFEHGEDPVRSLGDALGRMVEQVAVSLEHHTGVRMPQTARDREWIFSRLDEQGVGGVAKAAERDVGQFHLFEQRLEGASEEVGLPKRRAGSRCEDKAACGVALCSKRGKRRFRELGKVNDTSRFRCLRLGEYEMTVAVFCQCAFDGDRPRVEVDVIPK